MSLTGARLSAPARVEVTIDPGELGDGGEWLPFLARWDDGSGVWVPMPGGFDADRGVVWAETTEFSFWQAFKRNLLKLLAEIQEFVEGFWDVDVGVIEHPSSCENPSQAVSWELAPIVGDPLLHVCVMEGEDPSTVVVRVTNNRSYALMLTPSEGVSLVGVEPGSMQDAIWSWVSSRTPEGEVYLPGIGEATFEVDLTAGPFTIQADASDETLGVDLILTLGRFLLPVDDEDVETLKFYLDGMECLYEVFASGGTDLTAKDLVGAVRTCLDLKIPGWGAVVSASGALFTMVERIIDQFRTLHATITIDTSAESTDLASIVWRRVPHLEAVLGGWGDQWTYWVPRMTSVTAFDGGFVAAGFADLGDGFPEFDAVVWWSEDGMTWHRAPHDETVFGGSGSQQIRSVAASAGGVVAVGLDGPEDDYDAAVWRSEDGLVWQRVPHDGPVLGGSGHQIMNAVVTFNGGLLVVGGSDGNAAVWWSEDGWVWHRVPHDEAVFGGRGFMSSVAVGEGRLVGVGTADDRVVVWWSEDGWVWHRVPHDEAVFGGPGSQMASSVTAVGDGFVAVGVSGTWALYEVNSIPVVWLSEDGQRWVRLPHDEAQFGNLHHSAMSAVTAYGGGLIAVGHGSDDPTTYNAAVWWSADGLAWQKVPQDDAVFGVPGLILMLDVVVFDGRVVAVGADHGKNLPAVWWGTPDPAATVTQATATTGGSTTTTLPLPAGFYRPDLKALPPPPLDPEQSSSGSGCVVGSNPLWDGPWYGYIEARSATAIEFDLACFFTGAAATDEAAKDGVALIGLHYVRNQLTRTKTLGLHSAAVAFVPVTDGGYQQLLASGWTSSASPACPGDRCGAWIYLNGGLVTAIVEFMP